ncbi:MAG TPA: FKBP-type peptidyl-prolyl cis-trans isomerase [Holophagaceae bacterium]|nr:FKBP-type peptidyl-prolyl cis-trans isomerase [Holophagaceae bacterium]
MVNASLMTAVLLLSQAPPKLTTTPSGLQFVDLKEGTGAQPAKGRRCVVHYTGWLWERGRKGLVFDTSREGGEPIEFKVGKGEVIKGWDEGISTMKVGGKRRLIVPPALSYGSQGTPDGTIPPNATLCFEVELLALK